jgi:hypothetical protein
MISPMSIGPNSVGAISFPIPLASVGKAFVFTEEETEEEEFGASGCAGTLAAPTAPPGVLCVYTSKERMNHMLSEELLAKLPQGSVESEHGTTGANLTGLQFEGTPAEPAVAVVYGTWAVTAP